MSVSSAQVADLEAARKEKIAFGAVSWGYATIESLREHFPEEEFDSISDIKRIA
jgi:phosphoglycolate phosphatase